jgi:hypothetical protein
VVSRQRDPQRHSLSFMGLTEHDIEILDRRASAVGAVIGRDLHFVVAPNPEFVGLIAGPQRIFVVGPSRLSELAAHDIDMTLDALERGDQVIFPDEDGDPRLGNRV